MLVFLVKITDGQALSIRQNGGAKASRSTRRAWTSLESQISKSPGYQIQVAGGVWARAGRAAADRARQSRRERSGRRMGKDGADGGSGNIGGERSTLNT